MYQSKFTTSKQQKRECLKKITNFLNKYSKIYCRSLKRKVSLKKTIVSALSGKSSLSRLQCFIVAMDILKHENSYSEVTINGKRCFEIVGTDSNGKEIRIHLREDKENKNKILMFISSFQV